jgi:hypothetical protein
VHNSLAEEKVRDR